MAVKECTSTLLRNETEIPGTSALEYFSVRSCGWECVQGMISTKRCERFQGSGYGAEAMQLIIHDVENRHDKQT